MAANRVLDTIRLGGAAEPRCRLWCQSAGAEAARTQYGQPRNLRDWPIDSLAK